MFFTADFQVTSPDSGIGTGIPYAWTGSLTVASDSGLNDVLFSGVLSGTGQASMCFADGSTGAVGADTDCVSGDRPAPVPERGTAVLLVAGLLGAAAVQRARRRDA